MTKRIRVLLISTGFLIEAQSGGIARFTTELCGALDRERIEPILCGLWNYGTQLERDRIAQLRANGIEAFTATDWQERASFWNVVRAFQGIRRWLAEHRVDIIHSHSEFSDLPVAIAGRLSNTPVLIRTLHNHEWRRRPLLRPFARLLYPLLYDVELGISKHVVGELDRRLVARAIGRKAIYMNAAIGLQRLQNAQGQSFEIKQSLNIPKNAQVVGTVGRLSKQKGYGNLLKAAKLVIEQLPQTFFVLIGSGELEADLRWMARQLNIEANVVFAGPRSDVEELLKCMDLFVSSSLWEGMPGVVLDSMAAGVPVVATNIPGTREILQDQVTGWLVPPANPHALATAIVRGLEDSDSRAALAKRALSIVANFSIQESAAKHAELYRAVLHCDRIHTAP